MVKMKRQGISAKSYKIISAAVSAAVAIAVGYSVVGGNYAIAPLAVAAGMLAMFAASRLLGERVRDERTEAIASRSARVAIAIYRPVSAVAVFLLICLGDSVPWAPAASQALAYSICGLMLLQSGLTWIYSRR